MSLHFNIAREDLLKVIGNQLNITNIKKTLVILSNIFIETKEDKIIFIATDLEIGLKQTISAEIFKHGKITLPAQKLFEIIRESNFPTISFKEEKNDWVTITAGSSVYKLAGMKTDQFPLFPEYNNEKMVEVKSSILIDLIDKTIFSIAKDKEGLFTLTAAMLKKIEDGGDKKFQMVSSDGHRLSIMNKKVDDSVDILGMNSIILIPRRGIREIHKFCEDYDSFLIGIEDKQIVFQVEDSLLIIRLQEGDFPDFEPILKVINKENILHINRLNFLESLKRINLFTEDLIHSIKLEITENLMVLTSQNADFGSARDELEIGYNGDNLTVVFNCRFFIDTLQVMEGEKIDVYISSDESPCLITSPDDDGFLSIIMPMKI